MNKHIRCATAVSLSELPVAHTGPMAPKTQAPKDKSGRGNGNRRNNTGSRDRCADTRDDRPRRTTVFKTDSICISPNDIAKAPYLTIEVENRVGEGFPQLC